MHNGHLSASLSTVSQISKRYFIFKVLAPLQWIDFWPAFGCIANAGMKFNKVFFHVLSV